MQDPFTVAFQDKKVGSRYSIHTGRSWLCLKPRKQPKYTYNGKQILGFMLSGTLTSKTALMPRYILIWWASNPMWSPFTHFSFMTLWLTPNSNPPHSARASYCKIFYSGSYTHACGPFPVCLGQNWAMSLVLSPYPSLTRHPSHSTATPPPG